MQMCDKERPRIKTVYRSLKKNADVMLVYGALQVDFTIFYLIEEVGFTVIIKMLQIQILKYKKYSKICCLISINVLL